MLRSLQHPVNSHFCTYMHLFPGVVDTFSHTHTVRDTLVGSCTISEEEEEKCITFYIKRLHFLPKTFYIDHVANKISSDCYTIRSAKHLLSAQNLRAIYFSLAHSHLSHGNMVWGSAYQFKLKWLVQLQNKCVRHICKLPCNESTSSSSKKLGIVKISHIFNIQLGKLMYSFSNGQLHQSMLVYTECWCSSTQYTSS